MIQYNFLIIYFKSDLKLDINNPRFASSTILDDEEGINEQNIICRILNSLPQHFDDILLLFH